MNKKECISAIIFLLLFGFLFISVSYIVRTNGEGKERFAGFYAEEENSIDVLLMGSSAVSKSIAPGVIWKEEGITAYPLATNSQRTRAIRYLIEEAYKTQTPSLVVIELRMFARDDEEAKNDIAHIRGVTDNMKYSLHRLKTIDALVETDEEDKLTFYLDIFKYHSNWKMLLLPNEVKKFRYSVLDRDKGFEPNSSLTAYESQEEFHYEGRTPIADVQEKELLQLISFLKEKKQDALFLVTPCSFDAEYQGMMNYMKDIVESEGFAYLDMNNYYDEMGFDYRMDLGDPYHVNTSGAQKCSKLLAGYIAENYNISDRRTENRASWDECAKAFEEYYEAYLEENGRYIRKIEGD